MKVLNYVDCLRVCVEEKKAKDKSIQEKRVLRKLHLTENVVILVIAGMVNAVIMIMAAPPFNTHYSNIASISDAYKTLIPMFGAGAGIVFVITLLSSGISSPVVWITQIGNNFGTYPNATNPL